MKERHVLRKSTSGGLCTETQTVNRNFFGRPEFTQTDFIIFNDGKRQATRQLTIEKNSHGAGLTLSIAKFGAKRGTKLDLEMGLDELDIMLEYLNAIKDKMRNFVGERINLNEEPLQISKDENS